MNLEIKRGEYFVVLGPTGAGKSVLLETIIVYRDYMLFPHLTVKENIRFGLKEKK